VRHAPVPPLLPPQSMMDSIAYNQQYVSRDLDNKRNMLFEILVSNAWFNLLNMQYTTVTGAFGAGAYASYA